MLNDMPRTGSSDTHRAIEHLLASDRGREGSIPVLRFRKETANSSELLVRAATTTNADELDELGLTLRESLTNLDSLVAEFDAGVRQNLQDQVARLHSLAEGRVSIIRIRRFYLDNGADAQQLVSDSAQASRQLVTAVDGLVETAKRDIDEATLEAQSVQRFSTGILIAVVLLSLVCSILIVWLYVGRNLIARLSALSDSMLAIAGGNLETSLPSGGGDEIGRMSEALAVFRDTAVEVRDSNLRDIREARRRLVDAIESISEGFALYDADDRLVLCNTRYTELLYPGLEEIVQPGAPFETVVRNAADRGLIRDAIGRVDEWVEERLAQHRNPGEPHVQERAVGIWIQISERRTDDGGAVGVYTDITPLKRRQEDLEAARDQAIQATRAKSQFLANMSHELRTPMNAILGYTELIQDNIYGEVPDKVRDVINRVEHNGRSLLGLINDVLDLSKIDAGEFTISLDEYSMQDIVDSVVADLGPLAVDKALTLTATVEPGLSVGLGDERRIVQVLVKLVGNAIKFTDRGEVSVRASLSDGAFLVSVADTGIGISQADQQDILKEFYQSDGSTTRQHGGTGLGLAIAKRMVELHGGRLWVDSVPGEGSTFSFSLPLRVQTGMEKTSEAS